MAEAVALDCKDSKIHSGYKVKHKHGSLVVIAFIWKCGSSGLVPIPSYGSIVYIVNNWLKCRNTEIFLCGNNYGFSHSPNEFCMSYCPVAPLHRGGTRTPAWQQHSSRTGDLRV